MKVDFAEIKKQLAEVRYETFKVPNSTVTVTVALTGDNFYLGQGVSACVDPAEYVEEIGVQIAQRNAEREAEEALWRINGVILREKLKSA